MILVSAGTHPYLPFDRLIIAMDELASEMDEQVIIQYGCSKYKLKHADGFDWTPSEKMEMLFQGARVIVAQSAAGTIITGLKYGKPMILVPRLHQFNEHIDDHQLQLAKKLSSEGKVIALDVPDLDKLRTALRMAEHLEPLTNNSVHLISFLKRTLKSWDKIDHENDVNVGKQ
jgi:beta-1,4-N-acetylglucosaminyltransferase